MLRSVYRVCGNIRRVKLAIMQYENMTDGGQPQEQGGDLYFNLAETVREHDQVIDSQDVYFSPSISSSSCNAVSFSSQ